MISFYKKHPKFRLFLDKTDDFFEKYSFIYWTFIGLYIAVLTIVVFYSLPNEVRTPITSVVGGAISIVIVPMSINKFNTKQSQSRERYNNAYNLYVELADIICSMMNGSSQESSKTMLNNYIVENYSKMVLTFKSSLIWDIVNLNEEYGVSKENVTYYCEKIIKKIRKESGVTGSFYFNKKALSYKYIEVKGGEKHMAVHHGGKVGKAGKTLAKKTSSARAKSNAGKTLANHKAAKHEWR